MVNDKVILEMFSRVMELEEKVKVLEEIISVSGYNKESEATNEANDVDLEINKITRSISRKYVIDKLKEFNPELEIDKGNRAMGSGIVIRAADSDIIKNCKFYHSKGFDKNFAAGWHTVNEDGLNDTNIDFFIFNISFKDEFSTFIFKREELIEFVADKLKDQSNNYHFYFHIKHGKVLECRDEDKDVSMYLNRWDIIK